MKTPILSHTSGSYAHFIQNQLGKGFQHALLVYQEFCRTGAILAQHPAFNNAPYLLEAILDLTDFSYLPISSNLTDGKTGKFLLKTADGLSIESVLIPMKAGGTLCVSSQIGCRMGCTFCETGRMGLLRNLKVQEIVSQLFTARFLLNFSVRNIVFMGMGEPFDNYDAVMQAVRVLNDPLGFSLGTNHLTISTSGCIEGIERLMQEQMPIPNLAVSLNAPTDDLRNKLMPVNRKHPLKELYEALKAFNHKTGKKILVAYVLMKDQNDTLAQADLLADYLTGLSVKINLIPYNPQSRDRFQPPEQEILEAFTARLRSRGYQTLLRQTKGQKIMAACGQLGDLELKKLKKQAAMAFQI
ncbi:MAG: 23S rRNA (adenine(2503)-C(2))-methyltransferase RlmN [Candidatus Protochlamydia sp.]|nr:23S rRNA (adenine(2503)-C(2))-methyltransferase RlmN [Candidatus Protochlamydia sp.]